MVLISMASPYQPGLGFFTPPGLVPRAVQQAGFVKPMDGHFCWSTRNRKIWREQMVRMQ